MKRCRMKITEDYLYESYDEFKNHHEKMLEAGFLPHSISDTPEYYINLDMDNYFASYDKCVVNQY